MLFGCRNSFQSFHSVIFVTSLNSSRHLVSQRTLVASISFSLRGFLQHVAPQDKQTPMLTLQKSSKHASLQKLWMASSRSTSWLVCREPTWTKWTKTYMCTLLKLKVRAQFVSHCRFCCTGCSVMGGSGGILLWICCGQTSVFESVLS